MGCVNSIGVDIRRASLFRHKTFVVCTVGELVDVSCRNVDTNFPVISHDPRCDSRKGLRAVITGTANFTRPPWGSDNVRDNDGDNGGDSICDGYSPDSEAIICHLTRWKSSPVFSW